jgi:hypothetical protein
MMTAELYQPGFLGGRLAEGREIEVFETETEILAAFEVLAVLALAAFGTFAAAALGQNIVSGDDVDDFLILPSSARISC